MTDSILIFGGGALQISIIERAQALGLNAIVIDPDPNAIGKDKANFFFTIAANDYEQTKKIAIEFKVKGLVTSATDNPILMMCRIADELNLTFPSYKSCDTLLDKGKFKVFLSENEISHAKGNVYNDISNVEPAEISFPVIVKPARNSGSRGVLKCNEPKQLFETIKETLSFCKDGRFIIEEYILGEEVSVEAIVTNHVVQIIQITDKIITPPPYNVELGHSQPSKFENLLVLIQSILQKIINKTGLNNCAIHPEFKIHNNNITLIEIGPRLGGDFITSYLVPLSTGINIEDAVIKIAMGMPNHFDFIRKASLISYLNFPAGSEIINLISEDDLKKEYPELVEYKMALTVRERVKPITNSLNRYGFFILQGQKIDALIKSKLKLEQFISNNLIKPS